MQSISSMAVFVVCAGWLVLSCGILVGFVLMHFQLLPIPVKHLYLFEKLRNKAEGLSFVRFVDVPKRWFLHFYIIGLVCNTSALMIMAEVWSVHLPFSAEDILQVLHLGKPNYSAELSPVFPVLVVLVFEELQILRRLYETMSVSIYSNSKISMIHYFTGIILYSTFSVSLLAELVQRKEMPTEVNWALTLPQCAGIILFIWAWCKQFSLTRALAKLRRTQTGEISDTLHHVPVGGLFERVSCPHYLMEILIYLSFCMITRLQSPTVLAISTFVISNQVIAALLTHNWYRKSFRKYPAHRKAILPYLL